MKDIHIPVSVIGPGSQPAEPDDAKNDFMDMPDEMMVYQAPVVPEPEDIAGLEAALAKTAELLQALQQYTIGDTTRIIELDDLDQANRRFMDQLLGEGEVSVSMHNEGSNDVLIQESVLAGVWRVQIVDPDKQLLRDTVEVADIPSVIRFETFADAATRLELEELVIPNTVYNAAPLLTEIRDKLPEWQAGAPPHVINLSLLPHTEADLAFLSDSLGIGPSIILSRGYGNCRISSTQTQNVWWVQYFNSQETLILNTLEISDIPSVACAASEDLQESAERLQEILAVYQ